MMGLVWKTSLFTLILISACALDDSTPFDPPEPQSGAGSLSQSTDEPAAGEASGAARAPDNGAGVIAAPEVQAMPSQVPNIDPSEPARCPCTRRPEGSRSRLCPWGTGAWAAGWIGAAGGDLEIRGTTATAGVPAAVSIPGTALSANTKIVLTELTPPPPAGFVDYSPLYKLEPLTLELNAPGELSLPGTNVDGIIPSALAVYVANSPEGPFTRIADSYINAGFYQATLLHGGYYFVGYPEAERPSHCQ